MKMKKTMTGLVIGASMLGFVNQEFVTEETQYYVRTQSKTLAQFHRVDASSFNTLGKTKREIVGVQCYNEFLNGASVMKREQEDCAEYDKHGTVPNHPTPTYLSYEWRGYKTHKFNTSDGDLGFTDYAVAETEKISGAEWIIKKIVPVADAAISHDASSESSPGSDVSSISWSHSTSGSDRLLYVAVTFADSSDSDRTANSATYNSVSMTKIQEIDDSPNWQAAADFYLVDPATGSNTIVVTFNGVNLFGGGFGTSLNGVDTADPLDANNSGLTANNTTGSVSVTTVADNAWVLDATVSNDETITVGSGQTERGNISVSGGSGAHSTEGPKTPAGSVTMSWGGGTSSSDWAQAASSFKPFVASTRRVIIVQ